MYRDRESAVVPVRKSWLIGGVVVWTVAVVLITRQFSADAKDETTLRSAQQCNAALQQSLDSATKLTETNGELQTLLKQQRHLHTESSAKQRELEAKLSAVNIAAANARAADASPSPSSSSPATSSASRRDDATIKLSGRSTPVFRPKSRGYCTADAQCVNGGRCIAETHSCRCAHNTAGPVETHGPLFGGPYCEERIPTVALSHFRKQADVLRLPGQQIRAAAQEKFFAENCGPIRKYLDGFPRAKHEVPAGTIYKYFFDNTLFTDCDAAFYMCMIHYYKPKRIIEVGCGFSTTIAAFTTRTLELGTNITAIDPQPRINVRDLGIATIEKEVQKVGLAPFMNLEANDILFIDSSHRFSPGSDVHLLFNDVLTRLKPGVVVHVHDVYFPGECRTDYLATQDDEWHFLEAFLAFNRGFEIIASSTYFDCNDRARTVLQDTIGRTCVTPGSNLWIRRTAYHH